MTLGPDESCSMFYGTLGDQHASSSNFSYGFKAQRSASVFPTQDAGRVPHTWHALWSQNGENSTNNFFGQRKTMRSSQSMVASSSFSTNKHGLRSRCYRRHCLLLTETLELWSSGALEGIVQFLEQSSLLWKLRFTD